MKFNFVQVLAYCSDIHFSGHYGYIYSNMLNASNVSKGQFFYFNPKDADIYIDDARCIGLPVRGVIG